MADSPLIDIQSSGEEGLASAADDQLIGIEGPLIEEFKSLSEEAGGGGRGKGGEAASSTMEKQGGGDEERKKKPKCTIKWPWSKRDRLKRDSSLDKVEEGSEQVTAAADGVAAKETSSSPLGRCPDYFGVRSYLHHFYESRAAFKDPDVYEEADDTRHLLNTSSRRHRHCTAAWWKGV